MSRRARRGRSPHAHGSPRSARPASATPDRLFAATTEPLSPADPAASLIPEPQPFELHPPEVITGSAIAHDRPAAVADARERGHLRPEPAVGPASSDRAGRNEAPAMPVAGPDARPTCTVAQLRRFIKSRTWVPMHELRRRFGINGVEDDVTPIRVGGERLYIGLPSPEGRLMAELLSGGDVGYELSLDPCTPVVVGVYPMRPVPRS